MNRDRDSGTDEDRSEALRQSALTSWCREQGFTLEWKASSPEQVYSYVLSWDDAQTGQRNAERIASLSGIVPFVETMYPREWYLFWRTQDFSGRAPWCRWQRWVQVALVEGAFHPPRPNYQGDPTPYPSARAGAAASALLGLEMGARLLRTYGAR